MKISFCPICNCPLEWEPIIDYIDYHCFQFDHYYGHRLKSNKIIKRQIGVLDNLNNQNNLYVSCDYIDNNSTFWKGKSIKKYCLDNNSNTINYNLSELKLTILQYLKLL